MATKFRTKWVAHNSAPFKDNRALFAHIPLFSAPSYPIVSFKFLPCRLQLPWQRILEPNWE